MAVLTQIPGIQSLWEKTSGDSRICVAALDGLVDRTHPCFAGADLKRLPTLVQEEVCTTGAMSLHGTHVASMIFGQHGSEIPRIAPRYRGLIVPIFSDNRSRVFQLEMARAIETAVNAGAHIINISGGQLTEIGEAEGWLESAAQLCSDNNVLIVAAAGNDGCNCLHVPAACNGSLGSRSNGRSGSASKLQQLGRNLQQSGYSHPWRNLDVFYDRSLIFALK